MKSLKLVLAPMDGVIDAPMRHALTKINQYDYCESEFIRIVDRCVTTQNLLRKVPELEKDGVTDMGTPVYVQFLGQDPKCLAESAVLACKLGAQGIDLNFGCPAKQVNKSNGGAALLKDPELIGRICSEVREAVPSNIPVCAKMRLGFSDTRDYLVIANKIFDSGVNALCVHGRTKVDEYLSGTVKWDLIGNIKKQSPIPVIANGDIFDRESAAKCCEVTGCSELMLARGALYLPNLANIIKFNEDPYSYEKMIEILRLFIETFISYYPERDPFPRMKQYLSYLRVYYKKLDELELFKKVCRSPDCNAAFDILNNAIVKDAHE